MAISCTAEDLAVAAKCWLPVPARIRKAVRILNFCQKINGTTRSCDIQTQITNATCYAASYSDDQLDAIETYLTCQLQ